jgi:pyruvate formate lyase activating enzyme
MTEWVAANLGTEVPMHFTAFHPDFKMQNLQPTPPSTLSSAREIARANGIRHAYTGNVVDPKGGSTYCHHCRELLIGRDWYRLTAWNLDDKGDCRSCGTRCAGRFEGVAGDWGPRRMPVRIDNSAV